MTHVHSDKARAALTPEEAALRRARHDAANVLYNAECAYREAKRALSAARRAEKKASDAFYSTPGGIALMAAINRDSDVDRSAAPASTPAAA